MMVSLQKSSKGTATSISFAGTPKSAFAMRSRIPSAGTLFCEVKISESSVSATCSRCWYLEKNHPMLWSSSSASIGRRRTKITRQITSGSSATRMYSSVAYSSSRSISTVGTYQFEQSPLVIWRAEQTAQVLMRRFHDPSEIFPHSNNSFPDLSQRANWYKLPLLANDRDPTKPLSSGTQESAMGDMLKSVGVRTKKKTHIGRAGGAQQLERDGVEAGEIARLGRWNRSVMEIAYLYGLSWPAMKTLAGFEPHGACFLARDVPVPLSLQTKVFPDIEKW
jgi:hypothetical protein